MLSAPVASCRPRVLACVLDHPGAHMRDVARRCSLPLGTTLYHLDRLEARAEIHARRDGRYKRYYGASDLGRQEKDVMSALRHDAPRRIVLALLASGVPQGGLTQRELTQLLSLSRSTVSFHVAQLTERAFLTRHPTRPERRYEVADPQAMRALLARYRESLAREEVDGPLFDGALGATVAPPRVQAGEASA